jgi:hypothetical protein
MELEQFKLEKQNKIQMLLENEQTANRLIKF